MVTPNVGMDFYRASSPVLILSVFSMITLLQGVSRRFGSPRAVFVMTLGALLLALGGHCAQYSASNNMVQSFLKGGYITGYLTNFSQALILFISIVTVIFFAESYTKKHFFRGEVASLFLMVVTGMLVMVSTDELVTLFVGLELASIGIYALVGYISPSRLSQEGAIKYFVLGSVASALLLFGIALLYSCTGSLHLPEILAALPKLTQHMWAQLGGILFLAGLSFKLALAPFHLWAPDAYEAAPTGLTAFMATGVKTMIIVAGLRLLADGFASLYDTWVPALGFLAMLSILVGNLMALVQGSLKRMLAYSSVAHSGYMATALCALGGSSVKVVVPAVLFYLVSYTLISLGTFGVVMWLENEKCQNVTIEDLAGLAKKHPYVSTLFAVLMFSLAGMPPTAGFIGKLFVFNAALSNHLTGPVIVAAIGSTISLYFYLRVIVKMFMSEPNPAYAALIAPKRAPFTVGLVSLSVIAVLLLGTVMPNLLLVDLQHSVAELFGG